MKDEIDINAIAAKFIQHNLDNFMESATGVIKQGTDKLRLHLDHTYKRYLLNVLEKYSKAKSFLLRGEPVPLYQFYVPLNMLFHQTLLQSPTLNSIKNVSHCIIIKGSAGCGKSMMMRHLLLNSIMTNDKVPVFLELRQFNSTNTDLIGLIRQVLQLNKFNLGDDYIDKALDAGHFVLLLDGYDEVGNTKRSNVRRDIHDFAKKYEKNIIIISSRPDSELDGWQDFTSMQIQALSLDQAYELINKVPFDDDLKKKFLYDLRSILFEKHKSFLSNPLLLSIMLLTYGQSANIPNKLNVFYNQAYEALFERHDALKCGYKRDRLTTLDIQDFGRIFAAFCLQAYDKRQFEFDRIQALAYIETSQQITGLKFTKDDYLKDLIQAVCLLVEEGLQIVYAHRSFQEYFTAKFIADARPEIQKQLIKKYSQMLHNDNVFHLLYEIRPDILERYYLIPGIDNIFKEIGVKRSIGETHYIKYMKKAFKGIVFHKANMVGYMPTTKSQLFVDLPLFAIRHCGYLIGWTGFDRKMENANIANIVKKHFDSTTHNHIIFDTYPETDTLLRELGKSNDHYFSKEILVVLQKIRVALKRKTVIEEKSLEEILSNRPSAMEELQLKQK